MKKILISIVAVSLMACSNTKSTLVGSSAVDGVTYFMPNKDFIVTITVSDVPGGNTEVSNVTFAESLPYADRSRRYVLEHGSNILNDNKLIVTVNERGLLKTATSESKTRVADVLVGIAESAAQAGVAAANAADGCSKAGDYVFIFKVGTDPDPKCGVSIKITPLSLPEKVAAHATHADSSYPGFFYRQEKAYKISASTATHGRISKEAILYSPSGSETLFLPISKSLFADSTANLTFADGLLTGYTQDSKSELVGLFAIPAKVVGAYFKAVGEVFSAFSTKNTNEAALLKAESDLSLAKHNSERDLDLAKAQSDYKFELAQIKVKACALAVQENDKPLIESLECLK